MPDTSHDDAIKHLQEELYKIKQQLRFYAQLTVHETRRPLTIQPETFSISMSRLAEQIDAIIDHTETLLLRP